MPAGQGAKSFRIASASIAPELMVHAVPALAETAFLQASFKHAEDAPLLPGRVSIYRDGVFVGRSPMALAAKDETVRLGFGADEKVKVARTVVRRLEGTAGLIGSSKTDEREFKTTIRNAHEFPIRVAIEDQMPVSETEDIQVEMLPVSTPPTARDLRDRRGVHGMGVRSQARRDSRDQVRLARALAQGQGGPVRRGLLKAQELRSAASGSSVNSSCGRRQAAQRIAPDRDQPLPVVADVRRTPADTRSGWSTERHIAAMRLASLTAGPITVKSRRSRLPILP